MLFFLSVPLRIPPNFCDNFGLYRLLLVNQKHLLGSGNQLIINLSSYALPENFSMKFIWHAKTMEVFCSQANKPPTRQYVLTF